MSKEVIKNMESMTMTELENAMNDSVNKYNAATEASDKVRLEVESKKLADRYNELAKLTVYAQVLKTELPVQELVKIHHYGTRTIQYKPVVDLVDGKAVAKKTGSVKIGTRNVDLFDFIKWAEDSNKKVCTNPQWETVMNAQRVSLNKAFAKAVASDSNFTVSKTLANNVLQAVFDAIIFVPGESGKNSVFPNKDCKNIIIACAAEYRETVTDTGDVDCNLNFLKSKRWQTLIQSCLYLVLQNKTLSYAYGDPEAEANDATVKITKPANSNASNKNKPEASAKSEPAAK